MLLFVDDDTIACMGLLVPDHPFQVYYKVQQLLLQSATAYFITKQDGLLLQSAAAFLIYYKVRQVLLQSSTIITEHSPPPHRVENLSLRRPI